MPRADANEDEAVMKALGWDAQEVEQKSFIAKAFDAMPFGGASRAANRRYAHLIVLLIYLGLLYLLPAIVIVFTSMFVVVAALWTLMTVKSGGWAAVYKATQPVYDEFDRTYGLTERYQRRQWLQEYRAERERREAFERSIPALTQKEWHLLVDAVGGCEIRSCGETGDLIIHRITPRRDGGTNSLRNLVVLCPKHNEDTRLGVIGKQDLQEIARGMQRFRTPIWSKWRW